MASVNFYLNRPFKKGTGKKHSTKILNPKETAIILYVAYPNRNVIKVGTGERILAKNWDFEKKQVKSSTAGSLAFNNRLFFLKSEVFQAITIATTENPSISLLQIRRIVEGVLEGKKPKFEKKTFLEYFQQFIDERSTIREFTTIKKYKSIRNVVCEYLENRNIQPSVFYFESLDHDFDVDFRDYLIHERKNLNNTIAKAYEVLTVVMKWGRKKRLHNNLSFENFLPTPIDKSEVIFLNLDEIGAIEALKLSGVTELARDIFMFAYYAGGQRISDALSLKHKDIIIDETYSTGSWHLFQKKQKKTERIVIPLLDKAISYLKKYHRANSLGNSYVFPKLFESKIVHEQDLNEAIKEFCKDAGITQQHRSIKYSGHYERERIESKSQFISFKVARKSFVSNSLKLGMSPELIIKFTGHSTVKVMREHYLGISEDFKRETLFKFWQPKSEHEPETK